MSAPLWHGSIQAEPASKANSRRLVPYQKGGKTRLRSIKSEKGLLFLDAAGKCITPPEKPIEGEVMMVATLYYATRRPDLDESLVMDALEKCGVVKNDRQIREKHIYHALDKENPRAEIEIWPRAVSIGCA